MTDTTTGPGLELEAVHDELLQLGSATLYEASGWDTFLPAAIRPAWAGARIVGRALPVSAVPGDNLPLHLAVEAARPGDVLVVDARGAVNGYWGEVLTVAAQTRGVVGLIIDGGVRDVDRLEALGFPAFSRWIAIEGTLKDDPGTVGDPITIGRVTIERGDVIVGDRDGVAVLPAARFSEVLAASRARATKEAEFIERIRGGELTMDVYGFRSELGS